MKLLSYYKNGNATVAIYADGTRVIEWEDGQELQLDFPLNIDIRLMTKCDFGYNPSTGRSVCTFCHESATTDGVECNYSDLIEVLKAAKLPQGMELAIGINDLTDGLSSFLAECREQGWIVNGTINQGALSKQFNQDKLANLINENLLHGVGISYRPRMPKMPKWLLEHSNTVVHVIAGIDDFSAVKALKEQGVQKLLVLGEKDFGFNQGNVNLNSNSHIEWRTRIIELASEFVVLSFDNLALTQLEVKGKINNDDWEQFYQGEHSFYIDAVSQTFKPSSRSNLHVKNFGEISLKDYFKFLENQTINVRDN